LNILGTKQQIDLLGEALFGHVLFLSLQIYGCRVIQKVMRRNDGSEEVR
jgi:hypothetical protein